MKFGLVRSRIRRWNGEWHRWSTWGDDERKWRARGDANVTEKCSWLKSDLLWYHINNDYEN